jgi:rare lipoprotein A
MNDTGDFSPFFLNPKKQKNKVLFGVASYYGDKFEGRKTASGEIFKQQKMTAACNKLPLGTRIRVTNIRNGKTVEVVINDRLHPKMKRIVDLTKSAAKKLGYVDHGLTKVKVEVIEEVKKSKN